MTPDDPRHGTTRGYHAGCHDLCCRRAMAMYEKSGRLARLNGGRAVPAIGYQRRVQALMRLGWSSPDIAQAAGWPHRNYVLRVVNGQKGKPTTWLERKTADALEAAYDKLAMVTPEMTPTRARTKARATRLGYAPPLAWDEIDDPDERPNLGGVDDQIDPVVVARILAHDASLARGATVAERRAVVAAWPGSLADLERLTGWRADRYINREDGAA